MTEPKLPTLEELERVSLALAEKDRAFSVWMAGDRSKEALETFGAAERAYHAAILASSEGLLAAAKRGMELESALEWLNATYIGGIAMRDMDLSPKSVIAFATGLGFPGLGNKGDGNG